MAALGTSEVTHLLTVPVDTPFLPKNFTPCMLSGQTSGLPVVMACEKGQIQPAHCLWEMVALADRLKKTDAVSRQLGPRQLFDSVETGQIDFASSNPDESFASINTIADLIGASRGRRNAR